MIKPKIGDKFYIVGNNHRGYTGKNYECTVVKSAVKYFTVRYLPDTSQRVFTQEAIFSIETHKQKTSFGTEFYLFESKEVFDDYTRSEQWRKKFQKNFDHWNQRKYTLEQYEAGAKIFNMTLPGDDNA